jgi:hypothetical protein
MSDDTAAAVHTPKRVRLDPVSNVTYELILEPRWVFPSLEDTDPKSIIYMLSDGTKTYIGRHDVGPGPVALGENLRRITKRFNGNASVHAKLAHEYFSRQLSSSLVKVEIIAVVPTDKAGFFEDLFICSFVTVTPFGLNLRNEI